MGLFDSKDKKVENATQEVSSLLFEDEIIESLHLLIEDFIALTNKRVLFVNKVAGTTKKDVTTIPYSKITSVSLSKGGFMRFSQEITIGVGSGKFECKTFEPNEVLQLYKQLTHKIMY